MACNRTLTHVIGQPGISLYGCLGSSPIIIMEWSVCWDVMPSVEVHGGLSVHLYLFIGKVPTFANAVVQQAPGPFGIVISGINAAV